MPAERRHRCHRFDARSWCFVQGRALQSEVAAVNGRIDVEGSSAGISSPLTRAVGELADAPMAGGVTLASTSTALTLLALAGLAATASCASALTLHVTQR